jgi:hypothetical protein
MDEVPYLRALTDRFGFDYGRGVLKYCHCQGC